MEWLTITGAVSVIIIPVSLLLTFIIKLMIDNAILKSEKALRPNFHELRNFVNDINARLIKLEGK